MGQFSLAELPSALAEHVPVRARLSYPTQGKPSDVVVGWLVTSRLTGSPLRAAAVQAAELQRRTLFRSLGELLRRLHATLDNVALALQTKPELELSTGALDAFAAGHGAVVPDEVTRDWFVRLYDYF